jgi:hypothetical protein
MSWEEAKVLFAWMAEDEEASLRWEWMAGEDIWVRCDWVD